MSLTGVPMSDFSRGLIRSIRAKAFNEGVLEALEGDGVIVNPYEEEQGDA